MLSVKLYLSLRSSLGESQLLEMSVGKLCEAAAWGLHTSDQCLWI